MPHPRRPLPPSEVSRLYRDIDSFLFDKEKPENLVEVCQKKRALSDHYIATAEIAFNDENFEQAALSYFEAYLLTSDPFICTLFSDGFSQTEKKSVPSESTTPSSETSSHFVKGLLFLMGCGCDRSYQKALKEFEAQMSLAGQCDEDLVIKSAYCLGWIYKNTFSLQEAHHLEHSKMYFQRACKGHLTAPAYYELYHIESSQNLTSLMSDQAKELLIHAAEFGHPLAMYTIYKQTVYQDTPGPYHRLFLEAAVQIEHCEALVTYAETHTETDPQKSKHCLKKAYRLGSEKASFLLMMIYLQKQPLNLEKISLYEKRLSLDFVLHELLLDQIRILAKYYVDQKQFTKAWPLLQKVAHYFPSEKTTLIQRYEADQLPWNPADPIFLQRYYEDYALFPEAVSKFIKTHLQEPPIHFFELYLRYICKKKPTDFCLLVEKFPDELTQQLLTNPLIDKPIQNQFLDALIATYSNPHLALQKPTIDTLSFYKARFYLERTTSLKAAKDLALQLLQSIDPQHPRYQEVLSYRVFLHFLRGELRAAWNCHRQLSQNRFDLEEIPEKFRPVFRRKMSPQNFISLYVREAATKLDILIQKKDFKTMQQFFHSLQLELEGENIFEGSAQVSFFSPSAESETSLFKKTSIPFVLRFYNMLFNLHLSKKEEQLQIVQTLFESNPTEFEQLCNAILCTRTQMTPYEITFLEQVYMLTFQNKSLEKLVPGRRIVALSQGNIRPKEEAPLTPLGPSTQDIEFAIYQRYQSP